MMDKDLLLEIFDCLNERLNENNLHLNMNIYGGCVMVLCADMRPATKDIDAVFDNNSLLNNILEDITYLYDLSDDWINQEVRGPLNHIKEQTMQESLKYSNLSVNVPSKEQMLAMKLLSARTEPARDFQDAEYLICDLGIKEVEEVLKIFGKYFPRKLLGTRQKMFINYIGKDLKFNWREL